MMGHKKKGSESSPMKAQMEAGSGDKEEEQDLHHDSEYTSWEEIVQSDAEEEGTLITTKFFPLLPMLMFCVSRVQGEGRFAVSGKLACRVGLIGFGFEGFNV
jgi:hypothetical protein